MPPEQTPPEEETRAANRPVRDPRAPVSANEDPFGPDGLPKDLHAAAEATTPASKAEQTAVAAGPEASQTAQTPGAAPAPSGPAPKLAEGVELIGQYKDSGFKNPPFIVRRADGQVVQLTELLFKVAENVDGTKDLDVIAQAVSGSYNRQVSADNVKVIIERKLRPAGVVAMPDGSPAKLRRSDPMLALKFRKAIVPAGAVRVIAKILKPLFNPIVVLAVLGGVVAFDWWLFGVHGVAQSMRQAMNEPIVFLLLLGLLIASAIFHELGHATACHYGGAEPGPLGAGLYIAWPAFYSDVTDAYRLGRGGRIRTDLGGVYFNLIFILATAGAYYYTRFEPLLLLIVVQHMEIVHQFLPFLRLDGYYVIADLTGVPDLFTRIKPILKGLAPGKDKEKKVTELKPWARVVVTVWVVLMIPLLLFQLFLLVVSTPRIYSTGFKSLGRFYGQASSAFDAGNAVSGLASSARILTLLIPLTAIALTFFSLGKKVVTSSIQATEGKPVLRTFAVLGLLAGAALAAYHVGPAGDYRPIGPKDRGTLEDAASVAATVAREPQRLVTPPSRSSVPIDEDEPSSPLNEPTPGITESPLEESPDPSPSPTVESSPDSSPDPSPDSSPARFDP